MKFVNFTVYFIGFHEKLGEFSEIHVFFHISLWKIPWKSEISPKIFFVNFRQINPLPSKFGKNWNQNFQDFNHPTPLRNLKKTTPEGGVGVGLIIDMACKNA